MRIPLPSMGRPFVTGLAALAIMTSLGSASAQIVQPLCRNVPNGDFHNGFSGWTQDPCVGGFGDTNGFANATIENLTAIGCDADVACLNLSTDATWTCDKPSGSASQSQMSISRTAVASGRYLTFKVFGTFEFYDFGMADIKYDALVVVRDEDGNTVKCNVLTYNWEGTYDCGTGIQALGAIPQETICCDLASGGISVGDTVTIEVIWSAAVIACEDCDSGQFFGSFCVDEFKFCVACIQGPIGLPLDAALSFTAASSPSTLIDDPQAPAPAARFDAGSHIKHVALLMREALGKPEDEQ